jgi:hypothetical protein
MANRMLTWAEIRNRAIEELTPDERKKAVLYLDEREIPPGSTIHLGGRAHTPAGKSAVAFIDREPQVNWGHSCRYIILDMETGAVQSIEAQFPPFLSGAAPTLKVVWHADSVPPWALSVPHSTPGESL